MTTGRRVFVAALGNDFRHDDGAGPAVIAQLQGTMPDGVTLCRHRGEGVDLIAQWQGVDSVILVDAVSSGSEPGRIFRFEIPPDELPKSVFCCSTHAFSLADVIHLAGSIGQLPPRIIVYGIEGKSFEQGTGLSPEVAAAAREVVERLQDDVAALR